MQILYLHQYFVPPQGRGSTRSYEFARRLIAAGHDVCMITSSAFLPVAYQGFQRTTCVEIAGIPTVVIPIPYSNDFSFSDRIKAFVKFALLASREVLRHPADVVLATSTPLTIAIPAITARLAHRIPMVFEVRDLWPELPIAVGALKNPVSKSLARILEWTAYHTASHIIALSPGMMEGVMRRGILAEKITLIPNSCDLDVYRVPPAQGQWVRERLNLSQSQPLVVYLGTFGILNDVGYLVDVAAITRRIAPEIHYLLVGPGAEHGHVRARAQELGVLDHNLWIWDPLPKEKTPDVLAAATLATSLFVPLKPMWNNSANKFFDALAASKPIAINYGGWQADLLHASGAGLVLPPEDRTQAAHDLAAFVCDGERLQSAAAAAGYLAETQFNRDDMAQRLECVLTAVIQRKHDKTTNSIRLTECASMKPDGGSLDSTDTMLSPGKDDSG
jgi:glycosyltransferase involved in cell wall biosynthesis